nr:hypothetical protein [Bacteroidota bacterium]
MLDILIGFKKEEEFYKVVQNISLLRLDFYNQLTHLGNKLITLESVMFKNPLKKDIEIGEQNIRDDFKFYNLHQLRNMQIGNTKQTETTLINWLANFEKGKVNEPKTRRKLANLLRPINANFEFEKGDTRLSDESPEAIIFHLNYFYKGVDKDQTTERDTTIKARRSDHFLNWGVRFLIDFKIIKDAYYEFEDYLDPIATDASTNEKYYKLRKRKYAQTIPQNFRLRITENQLNIAIPKKENPDPNNAHDFFLLRIGEKCLRFILLHYFYTKQNHQLNKLFSKDAGITDDLSKIFNHYQSNEPIDFNKLSIIEEFAVPEFLKVNSLISNTSPFKEKKDVVKYFHDALEKRISECKADLDRLPKLSRKEKNETVLEYYKYFDFTKVKDNKFLRKNEYEQMSIAHYFLNINYNAIWDKLKEYKLYDKRAKENENRIPTAIIDLIMASNSLDDLYSNVIMNIKSYLENNMIILKSNFLRTKIL